MVLSEFTKVKAIASVKQTERIKVNEWNELCEFAKGPKKVLNVLEKAWSECWASALTQRHTGDGVMKQVDRRIVLETSHE